MERQTACVSAMANLDTMTKVGPYISFTMDDQEYLNSSKDILVVDRLSGPSEFGIANTGMCAYVDMHSILHL